MLSDAGRPDAFALMLTLRCRKQQTDRLASLTLYVMRPRLFNRTL
jgi:hypothetical protein